MPEIVEGGILQAQITQIVDPALVDFIHYTRGVDWVKVSLTDLKKLFTLPIDYTHQQAHIFANVTGVTFSKTSGVYNITHPDGAIAGAVTINASNADFSNGSLTINLIYSGFRTFNQSKETALFPNLNLIEKAGSVNERIPLKYKLISVATGTLSILIEHLAGLVSEPLIDIKF